jgi:aspartyl-tRNA(Asn)/glutamyl-tRNA(Gln) amidotransferase subunit A
MPGPDPSAIESTIAAVAPRVRARETTSESLVESCLTRIAGNDPAINAFITVMADEARAAAREADREIAAGRYRGPLHGIPISVKDIADVRGVPTTAASRVRGAARAAADAEVVARLRDAGAVIVGKTNLHEFALGTTNEDSAFGPVRHPLDHGRSPGGSSGGSAASVLAGMAMASVGTDTGGSIRIPAAVCGLVGLKPSFGELPLDGVLPLSTTLDHIGPICRSVEDAVILFDVMRKAPEPRPVGAREPGSLRFGVLRGYFTSLLEPQVASLFDDSCRQLQEAGAVLDEIEIPHAADIAPVYVHIVLAEAAAYHAKTLDNRPDDYTPNTRVRLELGRAILAEDYVRALHGRDVLSREVGLALAGRSALLLPSMPLRAHKLGTTMVRFGSAEEPIRNVMLRLTQLFNVSGHPAISIPCGTADRLPVGLQLVGARHDTLELLAVARAVERHLGPGTSL